MGDFALNRAKCGNLGLSLNKLKKDLWDEDNVVQDIKLKASMDDASRRRALRENEAQLAELLG